jgi:hypothetical protein
MSNVKDDKKRKELAEYIETIDKKLLDNYLVANDDVRKCPKPDCKFAGILPERESGLLFCRDNLECVKCGHSWQDPL